MDSWEASADNEDADRFYQSRNGESMSVSEQKHTPGPWNASGRLVVATITDAPTIIGQADDLPYYAGDDRFDQTRANARMFAASLDLLAACKPVIQEAKGKAEYLHDSWNPDAHVELTLTIAEIRAIHIAIAKAGPA